MLLISILDTVVARTLARGGSLSGWNLGGGERGNSSPERPTAGWCFGEGQPAESRPPSVFLHFINARWLFLTFQKQLLAMPQMPNPSGKMSNVAEGERSRVASLHNFLENTKNCLEFRGGGGGWTRNPQIRPCLPRPTLYAQHVVHDVGLVFYDGKCSVSQKFSQYSVLEITMKCI